MGSLETVRAKVRATPVIGHWTLSRLRTVPSPVPSLTHSPTLHVSPLRVPCHSDKGTGHRTPQRRPGGPRSPHPRDTHVQGPREGAEAGAVAPSSGAGQLPLPLLPDANPVGRSSHGLLVCTWGPLRERPHKAADRAHSVWPACGKV